MIQIREKQKLCTVNSKKLLESFKYCPIRSRGFILDYDWEISNFELCDDKTFNFSLKFFNRKTKIESVGHFFACTERDYLELIKDVLEYYKNEKHNFGFNKIYRP